MHGTAGVHKGVRHGRFGVNVVESKGQTVADESVGERALWSRATRVPVASKRLIRGRVGVGILFISRAGCSFQLSFAFEHLLPYSDHRELTCAITIIEGTRHVKREIF